MKKIFLSVAIATIAASAVQAQQAGDPFKKTEEGWFWYQVDPEPKEPLKVEEVPPQPKKQAPAVTVSYTHLTLPTILRV